MELFQERESRKSLSGQRPDIKDQYVRQNRMKLLKKKIFFLGFSFFCVLTLHAQQPEQAIANEFIVLLKTGDDIERILSGENVSSSFSIERRISVSPNIYLLRCPSGNDNAALEQLRKT